jgi:hypothetical protein
MCGLMRPTVCESVQGQDTLPGRRSIGEVGVGNSGREEDGERVEGYLSGFNVRPDAMSHQEVEPND